MEASRALSLSGDPSSEYLTSPAKVTPVHLRIEPVGARPIGPEAQAILAKYLVRQENEFCFVRRCGQRFERWHHSDANGRAYTKAGIESWAPNRLRRAAATEVRKLHGSEAAQVVAGHAQANVTQIYAERGLDKAVQIKREVG